jgi:hypothetical protein
VRSADREEPTHDAAAVVVQMLWPLDATTESVFCLYGSPGVLLPAQILPPTSTIFNSAATCRRSMSNFYLRDSILTISFRIADTERTFRERWLESLEIGGAFAANGDIAPPPY